MGRVQLYVILALPLSLCTSILEMFTMRTRINSMNSFATHSRFDENRKAKTTSGIASELKLERIYDSLRLLLLKSRGAIFDLSV